MKRFTFNSPLNHTVIEEKGKKRYFVSGHITTEDKDLVNDIVTRNCMKDISNQFKSIPLKLDFDHETLRKRKGQDDDEEKLNLTSIPLGKSVAEKLDETGNFVKFELNPNWKKFDSKGNVVMEFDEVWENVEDGYFDSFSIAYIPQKERYVEEKDARLLDKVNMINVALTGNPINPNAGIKEVMAKSLKYLESKGGKKTMAKKEDKLDKLMKKVSQGMDLTDEEEKLLSVAINAAKSNNKSKKSKEDEKDNEEKSNSEEEDNKENKSESEEDEDNEKEQKSYKELEAKVKSLMKNVEEMKEKVKSANVKSMGANGSVKPNSNDEDEEDDNKQSKSKKPKEEDEIMKGFEAFGDSLLSSM